MDSVFLCLRLMGFIPFFDWGDDKLSKNFNLFPKDFLQKMIIRGTQEIFGKDSETGRMVGKVIMYGAPALANVDVSKRTGLASMLPQDTASLLFGATGSTIWGTGTNLAQGNYANALRSVSPGLFNIYSALWAGETKDARGWKVSVYEDAWDRIVRGLGFKSVDESLASDMTRINANERNDKTRVEKRSIDAYIENPSSENLKRLRELKIKPDRVKEERKKKKLDRLEQNMSKAQRKRNQYLLDFAK